MDYRFYREPTGEFYDEFTILIDYDPEDYEWGKNDSMFDVFGASEWPFYPTGFGQHCGSVVSDEFLESQEQIFWADLPEQVKIFALVSGYWGDTDLDYRQAKELLDQGAVQVGDVDHGDWNREEIWFKEGWQDDGE